ncbi:MAG: acetylornithine deacetylase/succinyl-diaminopimelate desuccinylase family protein [Vicinamibacterales bacterium]
MALHPDVVRRVSERIDESAEEIVEFAAALIRIPTVNPPGEEYETCARFIGDRLRAFDFEVAYVAAEGRPEHTRAHPRVNVIGRRAGAHAHPLVHLNGHFDVVPAGDGWTVDPFGGLVRDGRVYGRGACDMKAGIAAAVYAAEAVRRAGVAVPGTFEISGTVDEESGGLAGVHHLAERRWLASDKTDFVIIPEPLDVDRVCIGHRGVYWFEVEAHGRIGHGSMPFLGASAIEGIGQFLHLVEHDLKPRLQGRLTSVPVVPPGARHATINTNGIEGGQPVDGVQTPCVADRCRAVFDRRFLLEEGLDATRDEIAALVAEAGRLVPNIRFDLHDRLIVHPTRTPDDSPIIPALTGAIRTVLGRDAALVASPGTYDHKHVARVAGVPHCVAYGPGELVLAHQPDEYCSVADLVAATKVIALASLELMSGTRDSGLGTRA